MDSVITAIEKEIEKREAEIKRLQNLKQFIQGDRTLDMNNGRIRPTRYNNYKNQPECKFCKSNKVGKNGFVRTRYGRVQRWKCKKCGRTFYIEKAVKTFKRYTKGKKWTPIETQQLIEMYNKGFPISHMRKTLKLPTKRIQNKLYNLKLLERIKDRGF